FAQLLELDESSAPRRESIDHILKAGRHLLELINEVLDIARIESGRLNISPEPVRIGEVVGETARLVGPLAEERGIRIEAELPAEAAERYVTADRQRLAQVLLNLISNAVKYNVEGGTV